jgi:hypothetical protein
LYFVRDKEVVGVFVRFRAPLHACRDERTCDVLLRLSSGNFGSFG